MKVLEVIPRFNPRHGGGVNVAYNYSKFLARRGHQVTLVTTDIEFPEDFANTLRAEGVEVIPFHARFDLALFIYSPSINGWLKKNLEKYDIVHLNGARTYQNNCVRRYARRFDKRWVMQAHGSIEHIVSRRAIKVLYDLVWGRKVLRETARFIALTETEKMAHERMNISREKVDIIPNGIDPEMLTKIPGQGGFKEAHHIQGKMVLYLGRMHPSKGIEVLIEGYAKMIAAGTDATLVLAGPDDGHLTILKELAKRLGVAESMIVPGLLSEEMKLMALRDAEVFVTPRFYGYPITFLEAMACGTPIITSGVGDVISDLDGNYGKVVKFESEAFSTAMAEVINDDDLRSKLSDNAEKRIRQLTWDVLVENAERTYSAALGLDPDRM